MAERDGYSILSMDAEESRTVKTPPYPMCGSAYTGRVGGASSYHLAEGTAIYEGVVENPLSIRLRQREGLRVLERCCEEHIIGRVACKRRHKGRQ